MTEEDNSLFTSFGSRDLWTLCLKYRSGFSNKIYLPPLGDNQENQQQSNALGVSWIILPNNSKGVLIPDIRVFIKWFGLLEVALLSKIRKLHFKLCMYIYIHISMYYRGFLGKQLTFMILYDFSDVLTYFPFLLSSSVFLSLFPLYCFMYFSLGLIYLV